MLRRIWITCALLAASPAFAVQTSHWTHTSEADFKRGTMHNVVATNLGDMKLSRAVKTILEQDAKVSAVYALAQAPDGAVYAATGPHGVLMRVKDDRASVIAEFDDNTSLFALAVDAKGRLFVGVSGEHGKVFRIDHPGAAGDDAEKAKPVEVFAGDDDDGVQYVWALTTTKDGNLYVATGPTGKLYELKEDGTKSVILSSDENNLLSMISDGKDLLYVGTDPSGLVYRVNRKTKDVFVLFDAPESEITCLALDKQGNLYAGTGEADEPGTAKPQAAPEAEKAGRPEGTGGVPIPSTPPQLPNPPAKPEPNPGEPDPIPKNKTLFLLDGNALPDPNPGQKPGGKPAPATNPSSNPPPSPAANIPVEPDANAAPKPSGNAIYRIAPDGFVTEIFRQPVLVLSMIEHDGVLLVGTGSEGLIYQVNPKAEETVVLAKVDPKQVLSMLAASDGRILLGFANVGGIASMSGGLASEGTFTSPVLDAGQISRFGKIHLQGSEPAGSTLTISTHSGNVQDPGKAGWSKWTDPVPATEYVQVASPSARFLQYQLTMTSKEGKTTPVVDEVDVAYQTPNVAPVVKAVKVGNAPAKTPPAPNAPAGPNFDALVTPSPAAAGAEGNRIQPINWEAEDANGDALTYSLYYRAGSKAPWILLKDKLTETTFAWDTRTVADGRYEIRVVASDAQSNPPGEGKTGQRVSDPVVVDNTPPVIGDLKAVAMGSAVDVSAKAVDRTSIVAQVDYAVDSHGDWQMILPSNKIYDSPEAKVSFTLKGLAAGQHQVTLRATDAKGNQAFETVIVTVEAPTAESK